MKIARVNPQPASGVRGEVNGSVGWGEKLVIEDIFVVLLIITNEMTLEM